jgi:stage III sporulation protein AF
LAWVKEWVRSLVMLLILASTLEMALPMGNTKRYVRLAMGLVIMLAMISPVAALLRRPIPVEWALFEPQGQTLPSLAQVMAAARRLSDKNQTLARAGAEAELAERVRQAVLTVPGIAEAAVQVRTAQDGLPTVAEVSVQPGGRPGAVRPVAPVRIGGFGSSGREETRTVDPELAGRVEAAVRASLGSDVQVTVRLAPERRQ